MGSKGTPNLASTSPSPNLASTSPSHNLLIDVTQSQTSSDEPLTSNSYQFQFELVSAINARPTKQYLPLSCLALRRRLAWIRGRILLRDRERSLEHTDASHTDTDLVGWSRSTYTALTMPHTRPLPFVLPSFNEYRAVIKTVLHCPLNNHGVS